ncbi:MAG: hypothetical protein HRT71_11215 [Flavobacteriales bacterium]|nr:hypothetical protein [Flavobacteriales bacterium]
MKFLITIYAIFLFYGCSGAQESKLTFGGAKDDVGYSFCSNGTGGYILVGLTRSIGKGSDDVLVINIDSTGNVLWKKTYGGSRFDIPRAIERTSDGGYVIYGSKWDGGSYRQDGYLMKLDTSGIQLFGKYFGEGQADDGISVEETSDKGFILSGFSRSAPGAGGYHVIKTDKDGIEEWHVYFGENGKDIAFDAIETAEGDFLVTGLLSGFFLYSEFEFTRPDSDIMIYKLRADGTEIWRKVYDEEQNELVSSTIESPDGGYYILGSTQSYGVGSFDILLMKLDTAGNVEWRKTYGDTGFDYGNSIDISDDGYLYITGTTNNDTASNKTDVITIKAELDGTEIWTVITGGSESEYGKCIRATASNGCAVLGETKSESVGLADFYFLIFSPDGELVQFEINDNKLLEREAITSPSQQQTK